MVLKSFRMKQCKRCGKVFIPGTAHLYKLIKERRTYYYCSYNCWREEGGDNGTKRRN